MAIIGEDGTGTTGAEAYGADPVALITAYWAARTNDPLAAIWAAGTTTTAMKEAAARMAAAYIDATWGPYFVGYRASLDQGLEWPRIAGLDDDGEPEALVDALGRELPALPSQILAAQAELAARAVSAPLAGDADSVVGVTRESVKVGPISEDLTYAGVKTTQQSFGVVLGILAPLLNGSQPGAAPATWFWR